MVPFLNPDNYDIKKVELLLNQIQTTDSVTSATYQSISYANYMPGSNSMVRNRLTAKQKIDQLNSEMMKKHRANRRRISGAITA